MSNIGPVTVDLDQTLLDAPLNIVLAEAQQLAVHFDVPLVAVVCIESRDLSLSQTYRQYYSFLARLEKSLNELNIALLILLGDKKSHLKTANSFLRPVKSISAEISKKYQDYVLIKQPRGYANNFKSALDLMPVVESGNFC